MRSFYSCKMKTDLFLYGFCDLAFFVSGASLSLGHFVRGCCVRLPDSAPHQGKSNRFFTSFSKKKRLSTNPGFSDLPQPDSPKLKFRDGFLIYHSLLSRLLKEVLSCSVSGTNGKRTEPTSRPLSWSAVFTGVGLGAVNKPWMIGNNC